MPNGKKKKGWLWLYVIIWLFTTVMFSAVIVMQMSSYNNYREELNQVQEQIALEEQVREDLLDEMVYNESDAYIERQARDQLGLVRPDEILFINEAE